MSGSGDPKSNAPVEVDFEPSPSYQLLFDGMHVEEELGRPFLIKLEVSSGDFKTDGHDLVGAACTIWLYEAEADGETDHYFKGTVTRVVAAGLSGGAYRFRLEVRPWIWLLSQIQDCRIFNKMSAFEIVTKIFKDNGFTDTEDKRQNAAGDVKLEYCVQYNESSLDFVTRLMEQFGFYYYFTFSKDSYKLVIVDDTNAHPVLDAELLFRYDQTQFRHVKDHIWEWSNDQHLLTARWTFQDYNFTTPSADLTAKKLDDQTHSYGKEEVYEYPGPYDTAEHGNSLSGVRMEAITARRIISEGESNSRELRAGWRFKLKEHPNPPFNVEYLVVKSVVTVSGVEGTPSEDAKSLDTYRTRFHVISSDKHFRMERRTPRPVIRGPQTARVVGKAGDEITTDEYGRIKVKFHWDRSDTTDEDRTCWIRVAQTWGGSSWGTMVIPRVDQEVIVEFLEGNPDRPLITGVVYNANNKPPYTLPDNKTQTGMKSNSSPGGSGSNELRLEDKKGEEEFYIHAQYNYVKEVEQDRTITVKTGNDKTTVKTGDHSMTVSTGNHSTDVSAGNHKLDVSAGKSEITAAQSITLTVGGNSIKIDTSGITINGMKVDVKSSATMSLQAGAPLSLQGAMISLN